MPQEIFFQCSLPRVGSTLFQNIMNQDSRFYASANNGLLGLVKAARVNFETSPEFKAQDHETMARAFSGFCKEAMHGFYNGITDKPYVLDKSRGNFADYNMVASYYPNPKIICFVRNMPDIFASMEKMFRQNQHKSNAIVDHPSMQGNTTFKRVLIWHKAYQNMMDVFYKCVIDGDDKKMLFIKYESFCLQPESEMKRFYNFIGVAPIAHNYNNIQQTILEKVEVYEESYSGLLKIRPQLAIKPSDAKNILGDDIYEWVLQTYKDYGNYFNYS